MRRRPPPTRRSNHAIATACAASLIIGAGLTMLVVVDGGVEFAERATPDTPQTGHGSSENRSRDLVHVPPGLEPESERESARALRSASGATPSDRPGRPSAELYGSVRDGFGEPVGVARVRIFVAPRPGLGARTGGFHSWSEIARPFVAGLPTGQLVAEFETNELGDFLQDVSSIPQTSLVILADADGAAGEPVAWTWVPGRSRIELQVGESELISGTVVDERGSPVSGATVRATAAGIGDASSRTAGVPAAVATSGPSGAFELDLMPGTYHLRGMATGHASRQVARIPSGTEGITIELETGHALSGLVVDVHGVGVPEASVCLYDAPVGRRGFGSKLADRLLTPAVGVTESGPDGRFRFDDLAPGSVIARVERPGFAPRTVAVEITSDELVTDVELSLEAGGQLRGAVLDNDGKPVAGARVLLGPPNPRSEAIRREVDRQLESYLAAGDVEAAERLAELQRCSTFRPLSTSDATHVVFTDRAGEFAFDSIPLPPVANSDEPGFARGVALSVEATGFLSARFERVEVGDSDPLEVSLDRGVSVVGRVRSTADERALEGATIYLRGTAGGPVISARTGRDGFFSASGIPPNIELRVRIEAPGFGSREEILNVGWVRETILGDVGLHPLPSVRGTIVDAAGRPVAGMRVLAVSDARTVTASTTVTDASGVFELMGVPSSREVWVEASRADRARVLSAPLVLASGQDYEGLVMAAAPWTRIEVRVEWPDGRPVDGGRITFRPRPAASGNALFGPAATRRLARTGPVGVAVAEGLEAGDWTLTVYGDGVLTEEVAVQVAPNRLTEVVVSVGRSVTER